MAISTPSVAKIGCLHRVCHEIRIVIILDKVEQFERLVIDFINEELGDEIWDWQCPSLGCRLLISTSSGYSKLQGAGVRCQLVHRGLELWLDGLSVVGDLGIAVEFVAWSISGEVVEVSGKRSCPVTEGIRAITSLVTADESDCTVVVPVSVGKLHSGELLESLNLVNSVQEELISADLRQRSHLCFVNRVHLFGNSRKSCSNGFLRRTRLLRKKHRHHTDDEEDCSCKSQKHFHCGII